MDVIGSAGIAAVRTHRAFLGFEIKYEHFVTAVFNMSWQLGLSVQNKSTVDVEHALTTPYTRP